MKRLALPALIALTATCAASAAPRLSYVDLVRRLTDLEQVAVLPDPGEQCAQWSSYDRKSKYDATTGKYIAWDANGDNAGIIRKEGDQQVLAEMNGPGCIWRIWSATPGKGHVRIYLDGASEPAVDLPFTGYFDGQSAPFTRAALVHTTTANGWNNYTPIPYQKSCKIIADPDWGAYYQFTYTTFPKGAEVPTFKRQLSAEENAALDAANNVLTHAGPVLPASAGEEVQKTQLSANGGGTCVFNVLGPRAIKTIRAQVDPPFKPEDRTALREWTLQIFFDGEEQPSVAAPFGDFFGTAPGANPYQSLPCGLTKDGVWYAHWFMPFAKTAEFKLVNDGQQSRKLRLETVTVPLAGDPARYARFHTKWHRDALLPDDPERRKIDWTLLKTEGRGRFVGVMLHVWNPRGGWWGEGDEKFFVGGEKFPSTFGTGSEDYFGYAWSSGKLFFHALHNQPNNDGNSKGHLSVNRWQIADNIPFHTAFEGAIEKYYANERPTLYASTVHWYLAPGGKDPYEPQPLNARVGYWDDALVQATRLKGALEGEELKILSKTGGDAQSQDMTGYEGNWSNEAQLWWIGAKPGDRLVLELPVKAAGRYRITAQFAKAIDYGILQLTLDGKPLGAPVDFFHDGVIATGALTLGEMELTAGAHKLGAEIVGANEKAVKGYMFGFDYVKLEAVK